MTNNKCLICAVRPENKCTICERSKCSNHIRKIWKGLDTYWCVKCSRTPLEPKYVPSDSMILKRLYKIARKLMPEEYISVSQYLNDHHPISPVVEYNMYHPRLGHTSSKSPKKVLAYFIKKVGLYKEHVKEYKNDEDFELPDMEGDYDRSEY